MATFATPGTPSSRGRIVQRARMDISIRETSFDESATISTRLADERGWSIAGGLDTFGSACAWVRRSATTCRARKMSVPGSKIRTMDDSPATDSEWISSRNATPWSRSASSGTVISCSTSSAERPRASVWISTYVGPNSGRTSTGTRGSCVKPKSMAAAAAPSTSSRNLRLQPTSERIMLETSPHACRQ